jgi:hypothetical protein
MDIEVDGLSEYKLLHVGIDDFNEVVNTLKSLGNCPILERNLSSYFGDGEVYLDELNSLKEEVLNIMDALKASHSGSTMHFLDSFLKLTEVAIQNRKTIKITAD